MVKFVYGLRICLLEFRPIVAPGRTMIVGCRGRLAAHLLFGVPKQMWLRVALFSCGSVCLWLRTLMLVFRRLVAAHLFFGFQRLCWLHIAPFPCGSVCLWLCGGRTRVLGYTGGVASGRIFILAFKSAMAAAPELCVSGWLWLAHLPFGVQTNSGFGSHFLFAFISTMAFPPVPSSDPPSIALPPPAPLLV